MRVQGEPVMIRVTNEDGSTAEIGTWGLPGELIDNYRNQAEIGWHIMLALRQGAQRVEVVIGQPRPTDSRNTRG
jgi:hypothetical protein